MKGKSIIKFSHFPIFGVNQNVQMSGSSRSAMFSFPALPAGKPSRGNWYQDLLDDPGCHGDPVSLTILYAERISAEHATW